ncbi:TPA: hypothetical protein DIC38_02220 [Candidatus Nomurabacteria bacterium]|nr:MAG: hypothetical protein O210_OD1C00001G0288 [Parcubacteria bacterium RAAC4_OD1_1]HCY26471.1 hypothetical protein [Candidatus Nomurabacteria bacterium]
MIDIIIAFFTGLGIPTIVGVYLYKHPDETEKWLAIIFKLLNKIWKGFKYEATKYEVQSKVNSFVETLNNNSATNFPKISIKWAGRNQEEVIWEKEKIILVMRDKKHKVKNLVHASHLFVSETLLRRSKVHITKSQKVSLDLFSVKLILEKASPEALEYFISSYFIPQLNKHDKVSDFIKQYINIEKVGLFFPILVQELTFLGNTIYIEKPNEAITKEIKEFTDFLENFSKRQVGDMTLPETFTGKYIRCAVRIIATKGVREARKIEGRRKIIESWIQNGYPNIYLVGNIDNRNFMYDIYSSVKKTFPELKIVKEYSFEAEISFQDKKKIVSDILMHLHYSKFNKYIFTDDELPTSLSIPENEEELDKDIL